MLHKPKVCVVCFANYCRSPVAERILKHYIGNDFEIISAGLNPIPRSGMDLRSHEFLLRNNYDVSIHQPKKLDAKIISSSDIVFAIDAFILMKINEKYPNQRNKVKLFTYQNNKIRIPDPFRYKDNEYQRVMNDIQKVCAEINLI